MLESIRLENVGPAPEMKMDLAPRMNLITGDSGLVSCNGVEVRIDLDDTKQVPVIVYPRALSLPEVQEVERMLAAMYDIELAHFHLPPG